MGLASRRTLLEYIMKRLIPLMLLIGGLFPLLAAAASKDQKPPVEMTVYRSPTCSCCGKWLEHMKQDGFVVKDIQTEDMDGIKRQHGVPDNLKSCHTALVGGYVVEGHVPAGDIRALLEKKPAVAGISVPGMPAGTPGMEMGGRKDPYAVVQFDKTGQSTVFHDYSGQ
jgi:hypothetical protein